MTWVDTDLYCSHNAQEAARLSALAYLDSPGADIRWHDDDTDTEAFGWVNENQIVICFRGTSSITDAKIDLKCHKIPFEVRDTEDTSAFSIADVRRSNNGKIHRGAHMAVGSVWRGILKWLNEVKGDLPVFVCGHSLGAMNSCVLALRLSVEGIRVRAVYTFGCPRWCDSRCARLYNEKIRHYRHVNHNDVVARMPPWLFGFRHTGFRYYFNRNGDRVVIGPLAEFWDKLVGRMTQSVVDGFNDHKMTGYIANMK